ncbi:hydrogenase 4 subunit F [Anoxybacterium hadale]|uniref:Hydrogenase 4 subunit F n=1 Tax=Anoxybacterium hadale TaxID=3408580 RepID=A0ACD1A7K4_9FIRM|nr:hydrogenase 4 subunit F [Clostridiales bacterium]
MGLFLWLTPLMAALLSIIIKKTKLLHTVSILSAAALLFLAGYATVAVTSSGTLRYPWFWNLFYIDALSVILLDIVAVISLFVSIHAIGYLNGELREGTLRESKVRLFYLLMHTFLFTMVLALTVNNLGILWIAIEGTTLASTFLVGFHNDKHTLEAAWKYVIICSVGIAVALVGIIFLHLSSVELIDPNRALQWNVLYQNAEHLNSPVLRLSFLFILIGFGTKAGLAPMHTWLPDAHSQAPSPISALLSGVLLNSALYSVIRVLSIVNKNLGDSHFTGRIMIGFGVLSIAAAALFILTQRDYKRLLAYSSIEHMGVITLAMGIFTPMSIFAGLYHMINHSLTKSMLFLASGNILQKYGTRNITGVRGLVKVLPVSGTAFFLGLFAISGAPPFSIFASEISVFLSAFAEGRPLLGSVVILLLAAVFAGIAAALFHIFFGDAPDSCTPGETNLAGAIVLILMLILISVSGLYLPAPVKELLTSAQEIISWNGTL